MESRNIVLYLMTDKGYYCLEQIMTKDLAIDYVVSSRDANIKDDSYDKIKELCKNNEIEFFNKSDCPSLGNKNVIAIGWRWLINSSNVIVLHDSILPKYRGFNPLPTALINGDREIGVTALFANDEYDSGDIIFQKTTHIEYPIKIKQAINLVKQLYADIVVTIMDYVINDNPLPRLRQDHSKASYSLWRDEADYRIDWTQSSEVIKRQIDALGYPYKGASTEINHQIYRILDCEIATDVLIVNRTPGKIIFKNKKYPIIVCGTGLLKVTSMINELNEDALLIINFRSRFL